MLQQHDLKVSGGMHEELTPSLVSQHHLTVSFQHLQHIKFAQKFL
jgi:hypothetical protein